jgi:methylated-DNA-[protein]-cysteine S-methyltransferase
MKLKDAFYYSEFPTPLGRFTVAVDASGALAAAAFGGRRAVTARIGSVPLTADRLRTASASGQVKEWLGGKRTHFSLRLSPRGSPFQRRVWSALARIPYGATRSYGEIARALGSSARAVGRANATNPICVVVPCHRVIGADGTLTGYAFGEARKRKLLSLEASGLTRP